MSGREDLVFADPTVASRYRLVGRIGGGASSTVFEALERSTGRRVAVKVRRVSSASPQADGEDARRFHRETRLCAQLRHRNIVQLIDAGEVGALMYAVFELVPGVTLAEALAEDGALEPAEALRLMMQVLDALSCSHGLGIVHRDLKPANVMITRSGERRTAKVLDFGLGGFADDRAPADGSRLTQQGEYLGTPLYSAPEQLRGGRVTVLSDVYAWGLVFIECLTGAPAISGRTTADVVHAQLSLQPVPIPRALAGHPLGRLLRLATAKAAGARATVPALLRQLPDAAADLPPRARLIGEGCDEAPAGDSSGTQDRLWKVPLQRNANFTGRQGVLTAVRETLATQPPPAAVALSGLGGIGKTQIALEYAYRHAAEYELVAWLRAEEADALAAEYASLTELLGLPEAQSQNRHQRIEAVRRWLGQHRQWLLVFDNVPTRDAIRAYLPPWPTGHVVATSRDQLWRQLGIGIPVEVFDASEATEFLIRRTGDPSASEASRLCEDLGRLPLALEEAAAYIEATGRSVASYRRLLEGNRLRLFEEGTPPAGYPWTVRSTWEISLRRLEGEAPQAAWLLGLCAYLAADDVPLAEVRAGVAQLGESAVAPLADEIAFDRCIAALRRYSLVKIADDTLSLHRLVQLVTRDRLPEAERERWAELALRLVEAVYPRSGVGGDIDRSARRLLPHALAVLAHVEGDSACEVRAARLLTRTGTYMSATGVQERAIEHLVQALHIFERHPGTGEHDLAALLDSISIVRHARGELFEADRLLERALAIHARLEGPTSLGVGFGLASQAWIQRALGRLREARAAGERAVHLIGGILGSAHPALASAQAVTARACWELGQYDAAREAFTAVLALLDRARQRYHPMMAGAWFQTGLVALALGDVDRAETCARQGTDVGLPAYGPDHPLVLPNRVVHAQILLARDDLDGARALLELVIDSSRRSGPRPHADIALSVPLLAEVQRRTGEPALAQRTVEQALAVADTVEGEQTSLRAHAEAVLGSVLADTGDLHGAHAVQLRACTRLTDRFGAGHPAQLFALNALSRTLLRAGSHQAAEQHSERVLAIAAAAGLDRHLEEAAALETLADSLSARGRYGEAVARLAASAGIVEHRLGGRSARTLRLRARIRTARQA